MLVAPLLLDSFNWQFVNAFDLFVLLSERQNNSRESLPELKNSYLSSVTEINKIASQLFPRIMPE
jgi:hypothetical protein